jgi:hypothetical protein
MTPRRLLTGILPLAFMALLALLLHFFQDYEQPTWPQVAMQGCAEKNFSIPSTLLPPELVTLLGNNAAIREQELRSSLLTSIDELAAQAFPGVPINVNCERAPYEPNMVNVYMVANDPHNRFLWADGLILTRSDAGNVLVLGPRFWTFFREAWRPVLSWPKEVSSPEFASAAAEYYVPLYELYLQWAIAHELAHIKLGHKPQEFWWERSKQQRLEIAADVEAARMLRTDYYQVTPTLLGLVKETMKFEFATTYGHPWTAADGEPFTYNWLSPESGFASSSWHLKIRACDLTHPPFLLRSVSMLEAASTVALEQSERIRLEENRRKKEILQQEQSVESELALEQLEQKTAAREPSRFDQWPTAVNQLARQLNARIEVSRPFLGICLDEIKISRDSHPN